MEAMFDFSRFTHSSARPYAHGKLSNKAIQCVVRAPRDEDDSTSSNFNDTPSTFTVCAFSSSSFFGCFVHTIVWPAFACIAAFAKYSKNVKMVISIEIYKFFAAHFLHCSERSRRRIYELRQTYLYNVAE